MHDWNALALFGVVGLGMSTSATLLLRTVISALRSPRSTRTSNAACSC
jgi:hypothetical protein